MGEGTADCSVIETGLPVNSARGMGLLVNSAREMGLCGATVVDAYVFQLDELSGSRCRGFGTAFVVIDSSLELLSGPWKLWTDPSVGLSAPYSCTLLGTGLAASSKTRVVGPGLRKGLSSARGFSAGTGETTLCVFLTLRGATGLISSSDEISLTVGSVDAAYDTASMGDLGVFPGGMESSSGVGLLCLSSASFCR